MVRIAIVAAVIVGFAVAKVAYGRRQRALADRAGIDHPVVPREHRGPGRTWIVFATQFCATCGPVADRLRALYPEDSVRKVLVEDHAALATSFEVRTAPTLLEVAPDGTVTDSTAGAGAVLAKVKALASASGGAGLPA